MTDPGENASMNGLEPALADLADKITRRLQSGEPVNDDDELLKNPRFAGPIRRLLPMLRTMVLFGQRGLGDRRRDELWINPDNTNDPNPE